MIQAAALQIDAASYFGRRGFLAHRKMQKQTHCEHRELWSREGPRRAGNRAPKVAKQTHSDFKNKPIGATREKQTHYTEENKGLFRSHQVLGIK